MSPAPVKVPVGAFFITETRYWMLDIGESYICYHLVMTSMYGLMTRSPSHLNAKFN